jgi:hypothetical protein
MTLHLHYILRTAALIWKPCTHNFRPTVISKCLRIRALLSLSLFVDVLKYRHLHIISHVLCNLKETLQLPLVFSSLDFATFLSLFV